MVDNGVIRLVSLQVVILSILTAQTLLQGYEFWPDAADWTGAWLEVHICLEYKPSKG